MGYVYRVSIRKILKAVVLRVKGPTYPYYFRFLSDFTPKGTTSGRLAYVKWDEDEFHTLEEDGVGGYDVIKMEYAGFKSWDVYGVEGQLLL